MQFDRILNTLLFSTFIFNFELNLDRIGYKLFILISISKIFYVIKLNKEALGPFILWSPIKETYLKDLKELHIEMLDSS